jgi:glycosyltransferase involved in cell wall biosynthesis
VLVVADYYLPGFRAGGPIRAIANSIAQLAGRVDFLVVTRDHDSDGSPYHDVRPRCWNRESGTPIYYAPRLSTQVLEQCVRESDASAIWINSFFSRASLRLLLAHRAGRVRRPILLAPRGEFSAGALALKPRRKRLAIRSLRELGALKNLHWIASSSREAEDIGAVVHTSSITVVPESVQLVPRPERWPAKQPGRLRAVCPSRVAPMKNLQFLLEALMRCRGAIDLDVIGPVDDTTYWAGCRDLMQQLPAHVSVNYLGELAHGELIRRLTSYDVLALPSRGENFGHVVVEAWSAGCPVLVSDRTPWRNLAGEGVGWDLPLDAARWAEALDHCVATTASEFLQMRERAHDRARRAWRDGLRGADTFRDLIVERAAGLDPARRGTAEGTVAPFANSVVADTNKCG